MGKSGSLLFLFLLVRWLVGISVAQEWTAYTTADGLAGNSIWFIREDEKGYLWFVTAFDGASRYDGVRFQNLNTTHGLASDNIYSILADKNGGFWLGTDRGISHYDGEYFRSWNAGDGLASDDVTCILEDHDGALWLGTDRGVSKYDGRTFQNFDLTEDDTDRAITCILEDRGNHLWLGTEKGVFRYDGKDFQPVSGLDSALAVQVICEDKEGNLWFGTAAGLYGKNANAATIEGPRVEASVSAVLEDRAGHLWLATESRGALEFDPQSRRVEARKGWTDDAVLSMLEDHRGNLWFGTAEGISRFNGKEIRNYTEIDGNDLSFVRAIWEDGDDNLWFGTENGAFKYALETLRQFTTADGLAGNSVQAVLEDGDGYVWFGTESGLSRFDGESFADVDLQSDGSADEHILSMCRDGEGNLWIGTLTGVYKNRAPFVGGDVRIDPPVRAIQEDGAGHIWLATAAGVARYDGAALHSFAVDNGAELLVDSNGSAWVGSWEDGLYEYADGESLVRHTMREGLASNHITWIVEARDGNIWFGLKGGISQPGSETKPRGGVGRYDGAEYRFYGRNDGLPSSLVTTAREDEEGNLWFGTDRGVVKVEKHSRVEPPRFTVLTKAHGLISNYVTAICVDGAGHCWFGTDKGVSKYDGANFQNLFLKDDTTFGFIETIFADSKGDMWFVTTNEGVFRYTPPAADVGPRIHLTRIEADRIYRDGFEDIKIPITTQRVTFEFKAISFKTQPGKMRFTHMLGGRDADWRSPTHEKRVHRGGLEPGSYQFMVRAIDEDLHYSRRLATAHITLFEPFYLTSQFVVLMALMGVFSTAGAVYLVVQWNRQRRLAAQFRESLRLQKEAERIQDAKMESLRQFVAGIAHDVNNPIGAISGSNDVSSRAVARVKDILAEKYSRELAEDRQLTRTFAVLEKINETNKVASQRIADVVANLRSFVRLDEAEWDRVDLREGIDAVVAYLESELAGRIVVEKEYGDIPPTFCSLTSLNQAFLAVFKNAVEAIEGQGKIAVKTWVEGDTVRVEISDDGRGIPAEEVGRIFDPGFTTKGVKVGVGLGLSICYQIVVDEHKGHIDVSSHPGEGTTVTISLPQNQQVA